MEPMKSRKTSPPKQSAQRVQEGATRNEYLVKLAEQWADHRFMTEEGRRFAYVQESEVILERAQTLGLSLTWRERSLLERGCVAGAIVEFGSPEPPMVYADFDGLKSDWLELHLSFDVPLTDEEAIAFDVELGEYSDEEDDELDGLIS